MSRVIRVILIVCVAAITAASCAKQPKEDMEAKRELAFEAWMSYYGDGAVKQPSGIYIKKIRSGEGGVIKPPQSGNWVHINYTGRVLTTGNIYNTRDSLTARLQGTFQFYTHYVPQYIQYKMHDNTNAVSFNSQMTQGMYDALGTMNAGDVVRVYIPSELGYGGSIVNFSSGYQGQIPSLSPNVPLIVDLELKDIVLDPSLAEVETVQQYAYEQWGQTVSDTITTNLYRRTLIPSKDTTTVKTDSMVSVYYVGRFMDGFVFDTNIADTARKYNIYKKNNTRLYDSITLRLGLTDTSYVKGFYKAIVGMKFGEISQTIFPSSYGYGSTLRDQEGATWIQPYSPLIFTIHILPPNGDGTVMHPYSIKGVKKLKEPKDNAWIVGYVVGAVDGESVEKNAVYSDTVKVKTNLLLSDARTSSEASQVIAIELPEGPIRDKLNLPDNKKSVYRKKIAFYGDLKSYLGQMGMTNVREYVRK